MIQELRRWHHFLPSHVSATQCWISFLGRLFPSFFSFFGYVRFLSVLCRTAFSKKSYEKKAVSGATLVLLNQFQAAYDVVAYRHLIDVPVDYISVHFPNFYIVHVLV